MPIQIIKLVCAYCDYSECREGNFPEVWSAKRYADNNMYWSCPTCGAFLYPEGYKIDMPKPFLFTSYDAFSRCTNASECAGHGNYRPSCEQAILSTRCLEPIHTYLWAIHERIQRIEKAVLGEIKTPKSSNDQ